MKRVTGVVSLCCLVAAGAMVVPGVALAGPGDAGRGPTLASIAGTYAMTTVPPGGPNGGNYQLSVGGRGNWTLHGGTASTAATARGTVAWDAIHRYWLFTEVRPAANCYWSAANDGVGTYRGSWVPIGGPAEVLTMVKQAK